MHIEQKQQITNLKVSLLLNLNILMHKQLITNLKELLRQLSYYINQFIINFRGLISRQIIPFIHLSIQLMQMPCQNTSCQIHGFTCQISAHILIKNSPFQDSQCMTNNIVINNAMILGERR